MSSYVIQLTHGERQSKMGLEIRRNSDGTLKRFWLGRYKINGNRPCEELCPIKGKPPASWKPEIKYWPIGDTGDELFEQSRAEALSLLKEAKSKAREAQSKSAPKIFEEAMSRQKGKKYRIPKVKDLEAAFDKMADTSLRSKKRNEDYEKWRKKTVTAFLLWWQKNKRRENDPIIAVTHEDAIAFVNSLEVKGEDGKLRTASTIGRKYQTIHSLFAHVLPAGAANPFDSISVGQIEGDETIHRTPLKTMEDIDLLLETAKKHDELIYQLATVGVYGAFRKGDLCELEWADVALTEKWDADDGKDHFGVIHRTLNKTKVDVAIPMFQPVKDIMDLRFTTRKDDEKYIFPEARDLYQTRYGREVLTNRLKRIYTIAFADKFGLNTTDSEEELLDLKDILDDVKDALIKKGISENRKAVIFNLLDLYASGLSFNEMVAKTGKSKSYISYNLTMAELAVAPRKFIRNRANSGPSMRIKMKLVTQQNRTVGAHAASIYDFHALRTTFVTIARAAGMTLEDIRYFTGHTETKMLERFYDQTTGVDIAKRLPKAASRFFMSETPKVMIPASQPPALPAHTSKEDLKKLIANLAPAAKKKLLKQALLMQQLLVESDDE